MIMMILKFIATGFGVGFGFVAAAVLFCYLSDRPQMNTKLRSEGYDTAVDDMILRDSYWDRKNNAYVKVKVVILDE